MGSGHVVLEGLEVGGRRLAGQHVVAQEASPAAGHLD